MHLLVGVLIQHLAMENKFIFYLHFDPLLQSDRVIVAAGIVKRNIEVIKMLQRPTHGLTVFQGDRDLRRGSISRGGIQEGLLQIGGAHFRPEMRQVAGRRNGKYCICPRR